MSDSRTPCIVITRDRVSYTRLCIASLERFPDLDIHIVDHGSTWPPMLSYLDGTRHTVHYQGDRPPRALWDKTGLIQSIIGGLGSRRYLVTDPDVVLDDECPPDWLDQLHNELDAEAPYGGVKVGLGLRLDDLPDTDLSWKIRAWESQFWNAQTPSGRGWLAPVDTTLALYQGLSVAPDFALGPAARLDAPYLARHLPWYGDLDEAETAHYRARALPGSSHWINGGW
jgi:hypothetical protein